MTLENLIAGGISWGSVIGTAIGAAMGLGAALPWRSAAQAAKASADAAIEERDLVREARNRLSDENKTLTAENAVLKAKTDLNGLRDEIQRQLGELKAEFKQHSDLDQSTATQTIVALEAVKAAVKALQK